MSTSGRAGSCVASELTHRRELHYHDPVLRVAESGARCARTLSVAFGIALALAPAARVEAQTRVMHLGARAQAMGGAFTGVADDESAFYWNPAGIAVGPLLSAGVYHGREETLGATGDFEQRATGVALGLTFMGVALTSFEESFENGTVPRR